MKNFEKHEKEVMELVGKHYNIAVENGIVKHCIDADCNECDLLALDENCGLELIKWLYQDDVEPSSERKAGQDEAWKLARKIASDPPEGFTTEEYEEIFGFKAFFESVFKNYTYAEVVEKIKKWEEWEKKDKIKIGDVVTYEGIIGVVTEVDGKCYSVLDGNGYSRTCHASMCVKTGRTLPVQDWLRQIEGEEL